MATPIRVLILEDRHEDAELMLHGLRRAGFDPVWRRVDTEEDYLARLDSALDLILADYKLPGFDAVRALQRLQERGLDIPFIVVSGTISEEIAVECMKQGAADYLLKDRLARLGPAVAQALEQRRLSTERKEAQKALELSHDTLSRRSGELQDFYHTVSHELKTPLTSAREFVSILLDGIAGPLTDDQQHYLQLIRESCDQLHFYVSDLLDATRLETGKLEVRPVDASMETLVANVVSAMTSAMQAKGIELRREIDPALSSTPLDERRINQVCMNLLSNALKYTPSGGVVTVRVRTDPDDPELIQFSVRDTGRGIAPEHLGRIFDKLYQVRETDTSIEGGMGLGLYIASGIVRLHGGRMWVESSVGGGSIFYFTVPKRWRAPRQHILFVDDDPATQEMVHATLEPVGFEVSVASDGGTALKIVQGRAADLAIVDLCLPGMPSPVLMGELRNTRGDLPLVLYTGYPDSQLMVQAMKFSPLTLLTKPCTPEKLVATVRGMLAERATSIQPDHAPRDAA